jgi:hypothetical protein
MRMRMWVRQVLKRKIVVVRLTFCGVTYSINQASLLVPTIARRMATALSSDDCYYVGVDVGTGSARASLFKPDGTLVSSSVQSMETYRNPTDQRIFEQSTGNIWSSICIAIQSILAKAKVDKHLVKGLGFDATGSLAVADWEGRPIVITEGAQLGSVGERNVILWADHRAEKEAKIINATGSVALDTFGGSMGVCLHAHSLSLSNHRIGHSSDRSSNWIYPRFSGSKITFLRLFSPIVNSSVSQTTSHTVLRALLSAHPAG